MWIRTSQKDLLTKGALPEEIWSETEKRYIFPKGPYPAQTIQVMLGHKVLGTLEHIPRVTKATKTMADEKFGAGNWNRLELVEEYMVYVPARVGIRRKKLINPPVKPRKILDQEFEAKKAAYVAKHGYAVEIPEWEDIFHMPFPVQPSLEEEVLWKTGRKDQIPPYRLEEIERFKQMRKARYLRMLASPTPKIVRAFGAYANMVDDAQDTLVTAAVLGRLAIKLAPKFMRRFIPVVGWAMIGADILNLFSLYAFMPFLTRSAKRGHWQFANLNPWSKQAKLKRAAKLMQWYPSFGDIVQVLQVSDSVCGLGISLGPIIGCLQDVVSGAARSAIGQPVEWKGNPLILPRYYWQCYRTLLGMPQVQQGGQVLDDDEHLAYLYATLAAYQIVAETWDDPVNVEAMRESPTWQLEAPAPRSFLTQEIMAEIGVDTEATRLWPSTGTRWASIQDLIDSAAPLCTDNLVSWISRNRKSEVGIIGGSTINQLATQILSVFGEEDDVDDYHCAETMVAQDLLRYQYYYPYDMPQEKNQALAKWIHDYYQMYNAHPPIQETIRMGIELGIQWRRELPKTPQGICQDIFPDFTQLKQLYPTDNYLT